MWWTQVFVPILTTLHQFSTKFIANFFHTKSQRQKMVTFLDVRWAEYYWIEKFSFHLMREVTYFKLRENHKNHNAVFESFLFVIICQREIVFCGSKTFDKFMLTSVKNFLWICDIYFVITSIFHNKEYVCYWNGRVFLFVFCYCRW